MLIKTANLILILFIVLICSFYLPKYYWMKFDKKVNTPFYTYSIVLNDFVGRIHDGIKMNYFDTRGNKYTQEEADQLIPLITYRQLAVNGTMPDSLNGIKLNIKTVALNNIRFRLTPDLFSCPEIKLYPLLESNSNRIGLELLNYYFTIKRRMEIFNAFDNSVEENLSKEFTKALELQGFIFPAKHIWGNPTIMKPFDEGYFIQDSKFNLFHLKMSIGKPLIKKVDFPSNISIKSIVIREQLLKEFYGVIVSDNNQVYLITYDHYKLIKLPLENFDASNTILNVYGDLFNRNLALYSDTSYNILATDRNYKIIKTYSESWSSKFNIPIGELYEILFPFRVVFYENSTFFKFNFKFSSAITFIGSIFFLMLNTIIIKFKKKTIKQHIPDLLIILLTGIYGFIAVCLIKNIE